MSTDVEMTAIEVCGNFSSIVDDLLTSRTSSHVIVDHSATSLALKEIRSLESCQQPEKVVILQAQMLCASPLC